MFVFADQRFRRPNLAVVQAVILRQFNRGLKPEFRFPVRVVHVHVEPGLFARKEKESEATLSEDCGTQGLFFRHLTFAFSRRLGPAARGNRKRRLRRSAARRGSAAYHLSPSG